MPLDYLEENILKAITLSSVYPFEKVEFAYSKTKSFDKTIKVLKYAVANVVTIKEALNNVF